MQHRVEKARGCAARRRRGKSGVWPVMAGQRGLPAAMSTGPYTANEGPDWRSRGSRPDGWRLRIRTVVDGNRQPMGDGGPAAGIDQWSEHRGNVTGSGPSSMVGDQRAMGDGGSGGKARQQGGWDQPSGRHGQALSRTRMAGLDQATPAWRSWSPGDMVTGGGVGRLKAFGDWRALPHAGQRNGRHGRGRRKPGARPAAP